MFLIIDMFHTWKPDSNLERARIRTRILGSDASLIEYIAGDYSLADITFIPFFTRLERYQSSVGDDLPNVKAWMTRLLDRPAVRSTL